MANPNQSQYNAGIKILKYIKGALDKGILYKRNAQIKIVPSVMLIGLDAQHQEGL